MTRSASKRDRTVGGAASWTLKGVDPEARKRAENVARRSGLTLAEWMNQVIADAGEGGAPISAPSRTPAAAPAKAATRTVKRARLSHKGLGPDAETPDAETPDAETPDAETLDSDPQTAALRSRLDGVERGLASVAALLQGALNEVRQSRDGAARRLDRLEGQEQARLEASEALEKAIVNVASQIYEGEARAELQALQVRESIRALRRRLERIEARPTPRDAPPVEAELARLSERLGRLETAPPGAGIDASGVGAALSGLMHRVEEGQTHTFDALRALGSALAELDHVVSGGPRTALAMPGAEPEREDGSAGPQIDPPARLPEALSPAGPSGAEERALADMAARLIDSTQDHIEAAVRDFSDMVIATEHRSADAITRMGQDVMRLAETLESRVGGVERRSDLLAAEVGGEIARIADAVDDCIARADDTQAATLEMLGGKIADVAVTAPAPVVAEAPEAAIDDVSPGAAVEPDRPAPPPASHPIGPAPQSEDWSVQSFFGAGEPGQAAPPRSAELASPTPMLDLLCEGLPTSSDPFETAGDGEAAEPLGLAAPASAPPDAKPIPVASADPQAIAGPADDGGQPPAFDESPPPEPRPSIRRTPATQDAPTPDPPGPLPRPAAEEAERLHEVDSFLAEQLASLTAPRPFTPEIIPEPPIRTGANRELIENARHAARLNAESKRRSPLDALTGRSEEGGAPRPPHDPGEVLDLRNGFGLLRPRPRKTAGG